LKSSKAVVLHPVQPDFQTELSATPTEDTIMAITFVDVSTYLVFEYGGPQGNSNARASISLGIPNAFVFLRFYPDSAVIPNNAIAAHVSGKPIYYVNYPYYQYAGVVDLLRNEKPIKFFFRDDNMAAYITTSDEPVGEGE
jgi:hypothetical protein